MLPTEAKSLLSRAARITGEAGWPAYLVGGTVRDMLLGNPPTDLDISVVGDASLAAKRFADELGVEVEWHERFGTSTVHTPTGSYHLDFVTARRESYPEPGALPVTQAGTLEDDLARRDFTINAMALPLRENMDPDPISTVVDPHAGYADLQQRHVAVLHDGSFQDDPTRLFRAIRIAERLRFQIAPHTLKLMSRAIREGVLATVSIQRSVRELLLCLEEPSAARILAALEQMGILPAIYPGLHWPYTDGDIVLVYDGTPAQRRDSYLVLIAAEYAGRPEDVEDLARGLRLTAPQVRLMRDAAQLAGYKIALKASDLRHSDLYNLLSPLDLGAVSAFIRTNKWGDGTLARENLELYLTNLQHVRPHLTGDDLRALGLTPGPLYRQILEELLAARLDGHLVSREEELDFVKENFGAQKD